jgi:hypothetical protein
MCNRLIETILLLYNRTIESHHPINRCKEAEASGKLCDDLEEIWELRQSRKDKLLPTSGADSTTAMPTSRLSHFSPSDMPSSSSPCSSSCSSSAGAREKREKKEKKTTRFTLEQEEELQRLREEVEMSNNLTILSAFQS